MRAFLPRRLAPPLCRPAMGLAMHDQRVDAPPDIADDGVARDVDPAGLGIDLDLAHSTTIGKDRIVHLIVGDDRKLALQTEARRLCASSRKSQLRLRRGIANRPSANAT